MIDLYTSPTPNGRKVSIMLEELGTPYEVHAIDLQTNQQKSDELADIMPNGKIPAIVDHDNGLKLFESGAILLYLAEKHGKFLPVDPLAKAEVTAWLMWQIGGLGPMAGQAHHYFRSAIGKAPYSDERLKTEVGRLYAVLNRRLEDRKYLTDAYSIADIACWPWVSRYEWHQIDLSQFPNVQRWYRDVLERAPVQRGYHVPKHMNDIPTG
ncbi:MAG: glutathione S-transferase N-terminal domain-containing protein [Pseudomonadota bacterium]